MLALAAVHRCGDWIRQGAIAVLLPLTLGAQSANDLSHRCLAEPPGDRALALCRDAARSNPNDLAIRGALAGSLAHTAT